MFKKLCIICRDCPHNIVQFIVWSTVFISFLFWINYYINDELLGLSRRWDIEFPRKTKIEKFYKTDFDFIGDLNRIFILDCTNCNLKGTILENYRFSIIPKEEHIEMIERCYSSIDDKTIPIPKDYKRSYMVYLREYNHRLIIIYDNDTKRYFVYEELHGWLD